MTKTQIEDGQITKSAFVALVIGFKVVHLAIYYNAITLRKMEKNEKAETFSIAIGLLYNITSSKLC